MTDVSDTKEARSHEQVTKLYDWAMRITAPLMVAGLVGAIGMMWSQNNRITTAEGTLIDHTRRIELLPPTDYRSLVDVQLKSIDAQLTLLSATILRLEAKIDKRE